MSDARFLTDDIQSARDVVRMVNELRRNNAAVGVMPVTLYVLPTTYMRLHAEKKRIEREANCTLTLAVYGDRR
ncbi:MAG: hypothetical protein ABI119_05930 [Gemmatimonadaceae bacterium]